MTSLRPRVVLAMLTASLLLCFVVPSVDAYVPRARAYHVGGGIGLDTNLLSVSGASAWAIDEYLASSTPLPPLGAAFINAERTYGVNARFLLGAALHESGWGTSYISRVKHNLFGYNAYDRDPFRYATAYATYAANINATAKFIKDFYLTPGGKWWGGAPTLRSMQQFWSSSHRWGENVSRVASSIRLPAIVGGLMTFTAPVVGGTLHGGDQASIRVAWNGGPLPTAVQFAARWVPVELDADVIASTIAAATTDGPGAADGAGGNVAALPASPSPSASQAPGLATALHAPVTVEARRSHMAAGSITLAAAAPAQPGNYLLQVDMLDAGGRALPVAQRVDIPDVEVRVWGDRAVSVDFEPSTDGSGAVLRITNTGRTVIPAMSSPELFTRREQQADTTVWSMVTVTASAIDTSAPVSGSTDPASLVLLSSSLPSDLQPGASTTFELPAIAAATGRAANWLSVGLDVLGDPTWLAAYSPAGAWFSTAGVGTATPPGGMVPSPTPNPVQTQPAMPMPVPAPIATPAPTPIPTPRPTTTPKAPAAPAPSHVIRSYAEHSSSVVYRGGWANASGSDYMGGNVTYSTSPGSSASFTFTGTSVSWIGPLGPTRGLALVLVDGRAAGRVDLWRSTFSARVVLFKDSFRTSGRHTVTIEVLPSPGHPYVAIDGFVVRT